MPVRERFREGIFFLPFPIMLLYIDRIEDFNQLYELLVCYFRNTRPEGVKERLYLFLNK
jgi:hypothetical protein